MTPSIYSPEELREKIAQANEQNTNSGKLYVHEKSTLEDNISALVDGIKLNFANRPYDSSGDLELFDSEDLNDNTLPQIMQMLGEGYTCRKKVADSDMKKGAFEPRTVEITSPPTKDGNKVNEADRTTLKESFSVEVGEHTPYKEVSYIFSKIPVKK